MQVTFFLVLLVPSLLAFFTCLMSCFHLLVARKSPPSAKSKKESFLEKRPLSLAIGGASDVASSLEEVHDLEAGGIRNVVFAADVAASEEPPANELTSIVPLGSLLSDGSRAGSPRPTPRLSQGSNMFKTTPTTPRSTTPRGSARGSPLRQSMTPGRGAAGPESVPEMEIIELPLVSKSS